MGSELAGYELLIVDGFNALGSRPDGWWRDRPRAMAALVRDLARLAEREAIAVCVVFDGRPHATVIEAAREAGLDGLEFAPGGPNAADRRIAALVRANDQPERVLVVSSDRRLAASVKAAGGTCIGAGGFVRSWLRE